jgi:type I restriction enzyme R subunit
MYVDKKLGGVNAVQTLSRLNRTHPGKDETMVLDFANEADEILEAFKPYYEKTMLKEATDPNLLYDRQMELENFRLYNQADLDRFARAFFDPKATQEMLHGALRPTIDRFKDATKEEQSDFRGKLIDFLRLYAFLSQIITFVDADLEKLYQFGRLLARNLPLDRGRLPREVQENIDMDSYRIQKSYEGNIDLPGGAYVIEPMKPKGGKGPGGEELEPLSQIIKELNDRFGTDFTDEDKVFIRQLEEKLTQDAALENSVKVNTRENARLTFDIVVNDRLQEMIDSNFAFYKQITDNRDFAKTLLDWLFDRYIASKQSQAEA